MIDSNKLRSVRINSAIHFDCRKSKIESRRINTYKNILRFDNRSKIAICSLYTPEIEYFAKYTTQNFQDYCDKNNYDFICSNVSIDLSRKPTWSKIMILQQNLKNYEWLMWIDADAAITSKDIKIESIIDDNYNIIITREDCRDGIIINAGVFLIKNTEWSKNFLDKWNKQSKFVRRVFGDQKGFEQLYENSVDIRNNTKIIKQKIMNSFPEMFTKGDFIIHMIGSSNRRLLKEYCV